MEEIIVFTLLGFWLLYVLVLVALTFLAHLKLSVNADVMSAQVMKLIMANNIDRAIKLCNAAPNALFCQAAKGLLTAANRPYRLELAYQEGRHVLSEHKISRIAWVNSIVNIITALTFFAGFTVTLESPISQGVLFGLVVLYLLLKGAAVAFASRVANNTVGATKYLTKIRNTLYLRNSTGTPFSAGGSMPHYLPPTFLPREDFTEQELADWRASVKDFERDMTKRRDAGEDFDVNEEYAKKADSNGVLPAI